MRNTTRQNVSGQHELAIDVYLLATVMVQVGNEPLVTFLVWTNEHYQSLT